MNKIYIENIKLKNNNNLIIRSVSKDDASNILSYLKIVGDESDNLLFSSNDINLSIQQEEELIENINKSNNRYMLVGTINNKIVCLAQLTISTAKRIAHNSELAISVRKDYWNIGVASSMIKEIINIAKSKNIKTISLGVNIENSRAINLYKKLGFKQVGIHSNYFCIKDKFIDEILMDLYL